MPNSTVGSFTTGLFNRPVCFKLAKISLDSFSFKDAVAVFNLISPCFTFLPMLFLSFVLAVHIALPINKVGQLTQRIRLQFQLVNVGTH